MNLGLEAKVGLFVVGCLILIGAMSLKLVDFSFTKDKGKMITAVLDDASGLTKDANVIFSGVDVGIVKKLELKNGKALVTMQIGEQFELPSNLSLSVRSKGFLGEKYAELKMTGNKPVGMLTNGTSIKSEQSGTDFDQLGNKIGNIADDVKAITASLRQVLANPQARDNMSTTLQNVRDITDAVDRIVAQNEVRVNEIMMNVSTLTARLSDITVSNTENINQIIANINAISKDLRENTPSIASNVKNISGDVNDIISQNKGNINKTLENMNTVTTKLDTTVDNINDITGKIKDGKGTIGKLVNDEETVKNLNGALVGLKDTLTKLNDFKVDLAFYAERYGQRDEGQGHFDLKITPSKDRYYLLGLSSSPNGRSKTVYTDETASYSSGTGGTDGDYTKHVVTTKRTEDSMTYTAMYAHRFWDQFHFRVGIKESTGAVGIDYSPLKKDEDKLTFSGDLYDFPGKSDTNKAHAKVGAKYVFYKNLFLNGGYDNFLNKKDKSWYVGAGVQFRDDDLKYLLGKVPLPTN